jgi:hypothetical protein
MDILRNSTILQNATIHKLKKPISENSIHNLFNNINLINTYINNINALIKKSELIVVILKKKKILISTYI